MQFLIFMCIIYATVTVVFASDTQAETLIPNVEVETLLPYTEKNDLSSNITSKDVKSYEDSALVGKHKSLLECAHFVLEQGEYELFENGTAHIAPYKLTLNASHYILRNGTLWFCIPVINVTHILIDRGYKFSYFSLIGLGISMISLLMHIIIFVLVPDLKNLPGFNLTALCTSLFCSYLLLFASIAGDIARYPDFCIATAFLTHFFLLTSILWMSIMSYDVYSSLLRATGSLRVSSNNFTFKRFGIYCLCSFGVAMIFAIASLLADTLDGVPEEIKPTYTEFCWFKTKIPLLIFFAGPVLALTCLNFIFFGLSAYTLHSNKMKQQKGNKEFLLKRRYLMYFRLSVIMGTAWIVGIVAAATHVEWLWYVFVFLNTFQGFFIFIAFTCSAKVRKYFREKYFGSRRISVQTFQSYCIHANSIQKDMDKVVENGKRTETMVMHL